jgi:phage tail sheath protein FI
MPQYLSPGVYVEEVPSAVKPIAGVSTSTAGFIGIVKDELSVPPTSLKTQRIKAVEGQRTFDLEDYPVVTTAKSYQVRVGDRQVDAKLDNFPATPAAGTAAATPDKSQVVLTDLPPKDTVITVDYTVDARRGVELGTWDGVKMTFDLKGYPVVTDPNSFSVAIGDTAANATKVDARLGNTVVGGQPAAFATIIGKVDDALKTTTPAKKVFADYRTFQVFKTTVPVGEAKLCTNFTEYKNAFGDFSLDPDHRRLTHAVYGFFNNGGTRCYVARLTNESDIKKALDAFELVDEIAIVAAPGLSLLDTRTKVVEHCTNMKDRFAILDGPIQKDTDKLTVMQTTSGGDMPARTNYAAWYFPWIRVFDPVAQKYAGVPEGIVDVPPSGHIAGVYARVDNERGVHKAPANENIRGALDVTQRLSKAHQDGLNPKGVNCIRVLNDNVLVWGARTIGGDANTDLKYINVRRTLLFLRKSIDQGTQWVVFEPNSPALWQRISRTVTAFLTNVWRSGALFGDTPQQAFYVKCDKETNPQSSIDNGQVVTEIGVAIVRPAEFVIFRISQMAGGGA